MLFKKKVINIVNLSGIIHNKGRKALSLQNIKGLLDKAFNSPKNTLAVALIINSPGGSASQSEIIANYIKSLSKEKNIPVISFIEDVAASGGYFIATAGEEIYALAKTSIVGSIGVLYSGFGFVDFIKKHGIERRIHTAGKNKVVLDSFQKEKPEDIEFINELLQETHEHFKDFVKNSRGDKLKISEETLFSGKFWLASKGLEFGLIDGIVPNYCSFLKEKYGKKIYINVIKAKKGFLNNLFCAKIRLEENSINDIINLIKHQFISSEFNIKNKI